MDYLEQRKKQILEMIATDHCIGADPYDNVARLKEVEKMERVLKKELSKNKREKEKQGGVKCETLRQKR